MLEADSTGEARGVSASLKRILEAASNYLSARVELVGIELQEEKRRLLELLVLAAAALLFGVLALTVLTFTVVAYYWDTPHRMTALLVLGFLYVITSVFLFIRMERKAHLTSNAFEATADELRKDAEWVNRHL